MKHVNKLNVTYLFVTSLMLAFIALLVLNAVAILGAKSNEHLLNLMPILPQTLLGGFGMISLSALTYLVWCEYGYECLEKIFKRKTHSIKYL